MTSTRSQIISFLERHDAASVRELSIALHLTPANIRHHLSVLLKEGVLIRSEKVSAIPRGRPTRKYALWSKIHADNFAIITDALLQLIFSNPDLDLSHASVEIAKRIAGEKYKVPSSLTQNLIQTIKFLNRMHYEASWEAEKEAPVIKFNHCPYQQILPHHPELCTIDVHLLQLLTNKQINLLFTQHTPSQKACKFKVLQS